MSGVPRLKALPRPDPAAFNLTDLGNAARFARDHKDRVRCCESLGWLTWDGARWRRDETGEVERLARDTIRMMYAEVATIPDEKRRMALALHAAASESRARLVAMVALAQSELGIAARASMFDREPFMLNTASGVVNLKTGEVKDHDPSASITRLAPTFYNRAAACPRWLTFLDRIMGGDLDRVDFLQRAVGYSLTGDTSEQVFFVLYGTGSNGKSTFLEVLRTVLGDYTLHTPAETLMMKPNGGGIPNDLARLRGARLVTAVESEDGRRLAESLLKQMTGGDTITARFLHKEFFEFRPEFKVWLATNHKPRIFGTDHAMWRRVRLVPFEVTIPASERDKGMTPQLVEESTGILAWAVEGCLHWQREGLREPESVLAATKTYREEMDPIAQFITDRCALDPALNAPTGALYAAFVAWCEKNGRVPMNSMRFSLHLQERGLKPGKNRRGRFFEGIGLAAESEA